MLHGGSGGFSVAELGGYAPAAALVALVVLIGGLAEFWIPSPAQAAVLAGAGAEQR